MDKKNLKNIVIKQLQDTNLHEVLFFLPNICILLLDDLLEVLISDEQDKLKESRIEQYRHNESDRNTYKSSFFSFLIDLVPNH